MEKNPIPIVDVGLLDPQGNIAPFHLTFYGIPYSDFMKAPGGGEIVLNALNRRKLKGYMATPFLIKERFLRLNNTRHTIVRNPIEDTDWHGDPIKSKAKPVRSPFR